jgi:hypothetical protein
MKIRKMPIGYHHESECRTVDPQANMPTSRWTGLSHAHGLVPSLARIMGLTVVPILVATSHIEASTFSYTLTGASVTGNYTPTGGSAVNFTGASLTFTATADSASSVSAPTTSNDPNTSVNYIILSSFDVVLTGGGLGSPLNLTVGSQMIDYGGGLVIPTPVGVMSAVNTAGWSAAGFGAFDTSPSRDYPGNTSTNPYSASVGSTLGAGPSVFSNLQTAGNFAGIVSSFLGTMDTVGGSLTITSSSNPGVLQIASAPGPSPVPEASGSVAGIGLAMAGLYQLRRRKAAGRAVES